MTIPKITPDHDPRVPIFGGPGTGSLQSGDPVLACMECGGPVINLRQPDGRTALTHLTEDMPDPAPDLFVDDIT